MKKLAAQLAPRMPWLARDRRIGALARLLHRHRLNAETGWSADRLPRMLELRNQATGYLVPDPTQQRNPLGYLNTLLTAAASQQTHTPPAPPVPRPIAAWQLEDEQRRQALATEDPALRAAVIAQIRADIAADQTKRTGRAG